MKKGTFGNLYSPYQKAENDTMDDWYIEYLNDTARIICIDGKVFSKIIHRCEFYLKPGFCLLVVFEPQEQIFLGDVLIDEEGNEFSVQQITITKKKLQEYFPTFYTRPQMEKVLFSLLEEWKEKNSEGEK